MNPIPAANKRPLLALCLLVPAPTLGVLAAFFWFPGDSGQLLWGVTKIWILVFPLLWWLRVEGQKISFSPLHPPRDRAIRLGLVTGFAFFAVILIGYGLLGDTLVDREMMRAKAAQTGLDDPPLFLGFAADTGLINSLREEYIWRWFVTMQVVRLVPRRGWAIILSGAAFTFHHVLALAAQMPLAATVVASIGVFLGGVTWSWLYLETRSVWPAWISHLLADVAVMIAGWQLLFS